VSTKTVSDLETMVRFRNKFQVFNEINETQRSTHSMIYKVFYSLLAKAATPISCSTWGSSGHIRSAVEKNFSASLVLLVTLYSRPM